MNVFHLGQLVECNLYAIWKDTREDETLWWPATIIALEKDFVRVRPTEEALQRWLINEAETCLYSCVRQAKVKL